MTIGPAVGAAPRQPWCLDPELRAAGADVVTGLFEDEVAYGQGPVLGVRPG